MKKFGRKLFLSCAALAACATTLVSTTFAWYTSNTEVKAAQIGANTQTTATGDDIYVAAVQTYADGTTTGRAAATTSEYSNAATPVATANSIQIAPVYYNPTNDSYESISTVADNGTVTYTNTNLASNVLEYKLRFQTTKTLAADQKVSIYVSAAAIVNTTAADRTVSQLTAIKSGSGTGIDAPGLYNINLLKALKMNVYSAPVTLTPSTNTYTVGTYSAATTYALSNFVPSADTGLNVTTPNAIGYYNAVARSGKTGISAPVANYASGTEIVINDTASDTNALKICDITNTGYVEVRFVFYLDGWDESCYDVCRKQGFTVALSFTSAAGQSILATA